MANNKKTAADKPKVRVRRLSGVTHPQHRTTKKNSTPSKKKPAKKASSVKAAKKSVRSQRASKSRVTGGGRHEEFHIWDDRERALFVTAITTENAEHLLDVLIHDMHSDSSGDSSVRTGTIAVGSVMSRAAGMDGTFVDLGCGGPPGFMRDVHIPPFGHRSGEKTAYASGEDLRAGDMILVQVVGVARHGKGPRVTGRVSVDTRSGAVIYGKPAKSSYGKVRMRSYQKSEGKDVALPAGVNRGNALSRCLKADMVALVSEDFGNVDRLKADLVAGAAFLEDLLSKAAGSTDPGIVHPGMDSAARYLLNEGDRVVKKVRCYGELSAQWLRSQLKEAAGVHKNGVDMELVPDDAVAGRFSKSSKKSVSKLTGLIERALGTDVDMADGGRLVIEQTEAFGGVIDVNGGRMMQSFSIADINLAAAKVIPAAIRCRGIGGQVVIDFVDLDGDTEQAKRLISEFEDAIHMNGLDAMLDRKAAVAMMGPLNQGVVLLNVKRTHGPLSERYWSL